jgi:RHS repeat-associated protein
VTVNGREQVSVWDPAYRAITTFSPTDRQATTLLDEQDRPIFHASPGLPSSLYEYDEYGRVTKTVRFSATDPNDTRTETFDYSDDGLLQTPRNALEQAITYTRDAAGRVTAVARPDKQQLLFGLDDNDNVLSLTPPGRGAHRFDYTPNNLLAAYNPPAVSGKPAGTGTNAYAYSTDLELDRIDLSDGRAIALSRDTAGRLATLTLARGKHTFTYDQASGALRSVSAPGGANLTLENDGPLWTGTTWSGAVTGSVKADYDKNLWLSSLTVNNASTVSFSYDNDGLVTGARSSAATYAISRDAQSGLVTSTTLGSLSTKQTYNGFAELATLSAAYGARADFSQTLERDALGRVTAITETVGATTNSLAYKYDALGRLIQATRNGVVTDYTYDLNGNRTAIHVNGVQTAAATFDEQDRILTHGQQQYQQTPEGDLQRRTDGSVFLELAYDELGNLTHAKYGNGTTNHTIDYVIDGFGRRIARKLNGSFDRAWLYRDALRPIAEIDSAGTFTHFVYANDASGGAPDFLLRSGIPYRVVKDHLGSVRLVVHATNGTVAQRLDYDEFGRVLSDTAPGFQPFGFAGGLYDWDTKLVRFGARDYDPGMGRWTSKDPIGFGGGDTNVYVYVANDPVNVTDPTGLAPGDVFRTPLDAALDWGYYYGFASIWNNREMGSSIYQIGPNAYTYTHAAIGSSSGVTPSKPPKGFKVFAEIHSHAAYRSDFDYEFSQHDMEGLRDPNFGGPMHGYLVTPDGSLLLYDWRTHRQFKVAEGLPYDPITRSRVCR